MKHLLRISILLTAFLRMAYPAAATSELAKMNSIGTYVFSEHVLPHDVQFCVPVNWELAGRTLPRRNLYRDGDVYDFQIVSSTEPVVRADEISVTLSLASGADIVLFNKETRTHRQLTRTKGLSGTLETVWFHGGRVSKNVWVKMADKWIIVSLEADAGVMRQNQKKIEEVIRSIAFVQKPRPHNEKI